MLMKECCYFFFKNGANQVSQDSVHGNDAC